MKEPKEISVLDADALEREAARWFVRFDSGDITDDTWQEFQKWRNTSPAHQDAFNTVSDFWGGAEILEGLSEYWRDEDAQDAQQKASAEFAQEIHCQPESSKPHAKPIWSTLAIGAFAASIFMFVVFLEGWQHGYSAEFASAVGGQKTVDLPDGSQLILNTNAALEVEFDRKNRRIKMARGEVFFEVAKDSERPFTVLTDKGSVRAIGTAFSVWVEDDMFKLLVTEGRVEMISPVMPSGPTIPSDETVMELSAGHAVKYTPSAQVTEVFQEKETDKLLDWRDGIISYEGVKLANVMVDLARYTNLEIEILGEALKQKEIVAYFRVGEVNTLFQALELLGDIEIEWVSDSKVRLRPAG